MAPLTFILEADARGENVDHRQAVNAATSALALISNSSTLISHLRKSKLVSKMNKVLLPLMTATLQKQHHPYLSRNSPRSQKTMWIRWKPYSPPLMTGNFSGFPSNSKGITRDRRVKALREKVTKDQEDGVLKLRRETGTNRHSTHRHSNKHDDSKTYVEVSYCMPRHTTLPNPSQIPCQETGTSPAELAGYNPGPS